MNSNRNKTVIALQLSEDVMRFAEAKAQQENVASVRELLEEVLEREASEEQRIALWMHEVGNERLDEVEAHPERLLESDDFWARVKQGISSQRNKEAA